MQGWYVHYGRSSHEELTGATQQNCVRDYLIFEDYTGITYFVINSIDHGLLEITELDYRLY